MQNHQHDTTHEVFLNELVKKFQQVWSKTRPPCSWSDGHCKLLVEMDIDMSRGRQRQLERARPDGQRTMMDLNNHDTAFEL